MSGQRTPQMLVLLAVSVLISGTLHAQHIEHKTRADSSSQSKVLLGAPSEIKDIKAYCIDFNWYRRRLAKPGMFANTDPATHLGWYKMLGVNLIQTFCVSTNGYAWYKNGFVPAQPGPEHDFRGNGGQLLTLDTWSTHRGRGSKEGISKSCLSPGDRSNFQLPALSQILRPRPEGRYSKGQFPIFEAPPRSQRLCGRC